MKKEKIIILITIFLICILLTSVIFIQFKTTNQINTIDIQNMNEDELKKEILSLQNKYNEANEKLEDTNSKILEYEKSLLKGEDNSAILDEELEESNLLAGLTKVEGKGVILTLEDNDEEQITSSHLLNLVNELKYAGAEAISINNNRITNFTDIVDVNYVIMIDGIKISSPYEVKAIGNQTYLASTLNAKEGFLSTYKETGLTISMNEESKLQIPKYNKELKMKYGSAN